MKPRASGCKFFLLQIFSVVQTHIVCIIGNVINISRKWQNSMSLWPTFFHDDMMNKRQIWYNQTNKIKNVFMNFSSSKLKMKAWLCVSCSIFYVEIKFIDIVVSRAEQSTKQWINANIKQKPSKTIHFIYLFSFCWKVIFELTDVLSN